MPKESGFRVLGDLFDLTDSYIDLDVDGVDGEGNVYLLDPKTGDTYTVTHEKLSEWNEDLKCVGESSIPLESDDIWKQLQDIGDERDQHDINNWFDDHLRQAQEHMFKAILEAGR